MEPELLWRRWAGMLAVLAMDAWSLNSASSRMYDDTGMQGTA